MLRWYPRPDSNRRYRLERAACQATTQRGQERRNCIDSSGYASNRVPLAGVLGLEPRLTGPEPVGLPITPYPMGGSLRSPVENTRLYPCHQNAAALCWGLREPWCEPRVAPHITR